MDPVKLMPLGPIVLALVGITRSQFPKVDKLLVVPVAFFWSVATLFVFDSSLALLPMLRAAGLLALGSMGLTTALGYAAGKAGEAMSGNSPATIMAKAASVRPPPQPEKKEQPL
jgi:hypothetical protein